MNAPFIFGKIASGKEFTDREKEIQHLQQNFLAGTNTILISPRRWGKSSLVKKAGDELEKGKRGIKVVHIDMFNIRTEEDFYQVFSEKIIKAVSGKLEDLVANSKKFLKQWLPKISFSPNSMQEVSFGLNWADVKQHPDEILNLPEEIAREKGYRIVICIDEFQNISFFDDPLAFQKRLRSHVSNLNNGQKLTFVTSIGCGVAMFDSGESFGETWIELGSISNPRGAACFIGPAGNTHTTYNNKIDKGIYVGMFQEGLNTAGQGHLRGKLYLYNVYGTDPNVSYHYKIYCILGDPSIHVWKEVPQNVNVNFPSTVVIGNNLVDFTVTHSTSGLPVENAIVCVTGNDIFATGKTNAFGHAFLDITAVTPEVLTVTVTGPNVYPFQGTMEVIPPIGPWVIQDHYLLNDFAGGNGDGLMDYGESILLSLGVNNIGTTEATSVNVVLSTTDPYITFTDNIHNYPSVSAGETVVANDAYAFTVANNIPDDHTVIIHMAATMGITTWNSNLTIIGHAPIFSFGNLTVFDPDGNYNGLLDPGETAIITIPVSNVGSSAFIDATAYFSSTSSFVNLNTTSDILGEIGSGETVDASFNVSVTEVAPLGESIDFDMEVIAGAYNASESFMTSIGLLIEDWETGGFNKLPWTMGGNADWTLVTDDPYEGVYCARSGYITDSQISNLEVTVSVTGGGEITFFRKVSSENGYDYLRFFIDDILIDEWEGDISWDQVGYVITSGVHTFTWQYYKDGSVSSGEDCAWIDNIVFPSPTLPVFSPG